MRVLKLGIVLVAVTLIGTVILSSVLLSSESEETDIVVGPYSYYAVRLEFYGMGILRYTDSQVSGSIGNVYLLELNHANYDRFVSGEDYDYQSYGSVGFGGGGESTESGTIWVRYLVFVNDNPEPATILFGYHATVFASLLVAGPLCGVSLLILLCAIIAWKRPPRTI